MNEGYYYMMNIGWNKERQCSYFLGWERIYLKECTERFGWSITLGIDGTRIKITEERLEEEVRSGRIKKDQLDPKRNILSLRQWRTLRTYGSLQIT